MPMVVDGSKSGLSEKASEMLNINMTSTSCARGTSLRKASPLARAAQSSSSIWNASAERKDNNGRRGGMWKHGDRRIPASAAWSAVSQRSSLPSAIHVEHRRPLRHEKMREQGV